MKASDNVFPKLLFAEGAAPATPAAGEVIAYAKTDGSLYSKDDTGTETPLGGGGGGTGTVDSVVAGTGIDVDATDPANPIVALEPTVVTSLGLADTATQPGDLAAIATTGAVADLTGFPGGTTDFLRADGTFAAPAGGGSGDVVGPASAVDDRIATFDGTTGKLVQDGGKTIAQLEAQAIIIACSDETTALTTGTAKVTFRTPYAMTLTGVKASVTTAPTGAVLTVDINEGGVSILSTKLTIDATEKTSTTAATPAVISDSSLAADAEITIDIDTVGSTIAGAGLKVTLLGSFAP